MEMVKPVRHYLNQPLPRRWQKPLHDKVFEALNFRPKVLKRKGIYERVVGKLKDLVQTFEEDLGDL